MLGAIPVAVAPNVGGLAGPLWLLAALVGLMLVPVSVGIAVTRYRLYDIDRLVSRGLAWGVLTLAIVCIYAGGVLVLQNLLAGVTQGETLSVAVTTLVAAALFQPLRLRLQRAMDHRFDRARYDAERIAAAFAERLRSQVDLGSVTDDLMTTIGGSLTPASVMIWLRSANAVTMSERD